MYPPAAMGGKAVAGPRHSVPGVADTPAPRGALRAHPWVSGRVDHLPATRGDAGLPETDSLPQDSHQAGQTNKLVVVAGLLGSDGPLLIEIVISEITSPSADGRHSDGTIAGGGWSEGQETDG